MADETLSDGGVNFCALYEQAMEARTQEQADALFAALIEKCVEMGVPRERAEQIQRSNLGYFAGYQDRETFKRVLRLYHTQHPVFGTKLPGPEKAFALGYLRGAASMQTKEQN